MARIIILHSKLLLAQHRAPLRHDRRILRPRMHALAVVIPLVAPELEPPMPLPPRLHAQLLPAGALDAPHALLDVLAHPSEAIHAVPQRQVPAVLVPAQGPVLVVHLAHLRGRRPADPVERVGVLQLVVVVLELHEGGFLAVLVRVVVGGAAGAGCLPDGVEVGVPPVRVPDFEIFVPVARMDGARVVDFPFLVLVPPDFGRGARSACRWDGGEEVVVGGGLVIWGWPGLEGAGPDAV